MTRPALDPAACARLLDAVDTAEALKAKSNAEIGRLLLDHVWAEMDLNSAAELVMSEAISRLAPDLEQETSR